MHLAESWRIRQLTETRRRDDSEDHASGVATSASRRPSQPRGPRWTSPTSTGLIGGSALLTGRPLE